MKLIVLKTQEEKARGLQKIKYLPENTFLLFTNIGSGTFFHTINCFIDIDIMPIDEQGRILSLWTVGPNLSNIGPMPLGTKHVVETKGGWAKKNGINTGRNLLFLLS